MIFTVATATAFAQSEPVDWKPRLLGRPLYLRGFWQADQLYFDGSGALTSKSGRGPVTLSGIEVNSVTMSGDFLIIQGHRIALARRADGGPGLERRPISSTTHLEWSLMPGDRKNFHAPEEIKIVVEPDKSGEFEAALERIFADGLTALSSSVPVYWKCFADGYFIPAVPDKDVREEVLKCVKPPEASPAQAGGEGPHEMKAPVLISSTPAHFSTASDLRVHGVSLIHVRVTNTGMPVGLQVVQALGAGLDEAALQAVSTYRFQPATRDGVPVAVDLNVEVRFQ